MLLISHTRIFSPSAKYFLSSLCQLWGHSARVMYDGIQGLALEQKSRRILRVQGDCLDIILQSYDSQTLQELERRVGSELGSLQQEGAAQVHWCRAA